MQESRWLFEGRPKHGKKYNQIGRIGGPILQLAQKVIVRIEFLACLAIHSSSHKKPLPNAAKTFLVYFDTLETHRVKFIYSEKATKKRKFEISLNLVGFSEYINFSVQF